jgi:putative tryptophan/tyrosine transport system substrate-binding protein
MRRRDFLALFGCLSVAWPLSARAQQPAMAVVGFLRSTTADGSKHLVAAFLEGLKETGFVDGENVKIEYRWADNQNDRLPALAADLVRLRVNVIAALTTPAGLAAKAATSTIPIVVTVGGDPVKFGLVASLNRPGGNVTGVSFLVNILGEKRLELLREMIPSAEVIGFLVNPTTPLAETDTRGLQAAADTLGLKLIVAAANTERDIEAAFGTLTRHQAGGLVIFADPFFLSRREQIVDLAARFSLPAIYPGREFAEAGGLMSYGTSQVDAYRQTAIYVGRILKGEKPADLPVVQSTKFEFVINLKTAKRLGLSLRPTLLATADEVIE